MQPRQQDSEPSMPLLCACRLVLVGGHCSEGDTQSPVGISCCIASVGSRSGPGGRQQLLSPSRGFMRDRQTGGGKAAREAERSGNDRQGGREGALEEDQEGEGAGRAPRDAEMQRGPRVVGPGEPASWGSPDGGCPQLSPHQRDQQPLGSQGLVVSHWGVRGLRGTCVGPGALLHTCTKQKGGDGDGDTAEGMARDGTGQGVGRAPRRERAGRWAGCVCPRLCRWGRGGGGGGAGHGGAGQGRAAAAGAGGCLRPDRLYLPWRRRPPLVPPLPLRVPPSQPPPRLGVGAGACRVCLLVLPRCRCLGGLRRRRRRAGRGRGLGLGRRRLLGLSYCR